MSQNDPCDAHTSAQYVSETATLTLLASQVSLLSFDEEEGPSPTKIKASIKERSKLRLEPSLKPNLKSLRRGEDSKPPTSQQSQAGESS